MFICLHQGWDGFKGVFFHNCHHKDISVPVAPQKPSGEGIVDS